MFFGVGVGRVFLCDVLPMFLLYYLVFRSRKCLEKILLMSGLAFLGFLDWLSGVFRGGFSGPEVPHFAAQKRHVKSSPFLSFFFRSSIFVTRWFLEGFGARTPLLVLEMLWVCVFVWISYKIQGVLFAVFGFRCFFRSFSLSVSFSSSFSSGGQPGCPFLPSLCLSPGCRTSGTWTGGSVMCMFSLFSVSSLCPGRSPFPFLFSLLLLSLSRFSLSLACVFKSESVREFRQRTPTQHVPSARVDHIPAT